MKEFIREIKPDLALIDIADDNIKNAIELVFNTISDRQTPLLYFNIIHGRYMTLLMTNAKNTHRKKELTRPGNPDVLIKLIKIKDKELWGIIYNFLLTIIDETSGSINDIYVIKVFDILTYFKKIKEIKNIKLAKNIFNTVFGVYEEAGKKITKKLSYVEADIFTYAKLYQFYVLYKHNQKSSKFELFKELELNETPLQEIEVKQRNLNLVLDKKVFYLAKARLKKLKKYKPNYCVKVIKHKEEEYLQYYSELSLTFASAMTGFPNQKFLSKK
jgi:hypothetical protein